MQNDIKSVKEEFVILESAQDLLEKIIYPTFDQFKETAKSFMEKSDINFFSSLDHRWEPFYHKKIRLTKKLRALRSTLCARVKTLIFEVCKVPPISIVAKASKISAWKKNPAISNSFRKLFDKVEEDEEDTYMTRIIKNLTKKLRALRSTLCARVKTLIFEVCKVPPISIVAKASKISAWKKNPAISNSFRKLFDKVEEDEEDTYMTRIIKNVWPKKKNIPNLQIAWVISIAEIILNPNNENIKISEEIIKPVLLKNLVIPERPTAPRSNKKITEIETSRKEKKKIRSIRKDEENYDDDDEADESDKAYEANEAYETDEGDEYYNEIINIDESEEE
ncbi:hypothetical protein Glove_256g100 [Diversispora epigaea]|uniref:Uncharacterized protein n=1 Tax=Diversispora epigaea TaxID=1348612 RepID=A0A397I9B2_9GLOM|nr:hypothetical protein Glove_256g100 [Diversispora epigaea]